MTLSTDMLAMMFDYNAAVNVRLLDLAATLDDAELDEPTNYAGGSIRRTLHHLFVTEYYWRNDCQGTETTVEPISSTATIAELQAFQREEAIRVRKFVDEVSEADLNQKVMVHDLDGNPYSFIVWQGMVHLLYHSAQHRSEIALWLTEHDRSPGEIDFINGLLIT
jgi:uncharacterized damage-inducible protein DinB